LGEKRLFGLPAGTFGSLKRIQLHNLFCTGLHVGCQITGAVFPFDLWFWAGLAVNALRYGHSLATALAGFDDGVTDATIVGASLLAHKKTFFACFNRLTEHCPSLL
jgi:hypothetical protein